MLKIYLDADACPVKEESYRVAARHGLTTYVVAARLMNTPSHPLIFPVGAGNGFDAADDWIADRCEEGDIVITSDIPLADRAIKAGAIVLTPKGHEHDEGSIGSAMATRELMDQLRQMGEMTGGPAPMGKRDKSEYLSALEGAIQRIKQHYS
jgi:uncharacterized protein YaiI (UPF0178 family)